MYGSGVRTGMVRTPLRLKVILWGSRRALTGCAVAGRGAAHLPIAAWRFASATSRVSAATISAFALPGPRRAVGIYGPTLPFVFITFLPYEAMWFVGVMYNAPATNTSLFKIGFDPARCNGRVKTNFQKGFFGVWVRAGGAYICGGFACFFVIHVMTM